MRQSGFAYAAKAATTDDPTTPDGWPPGWDWPGPPWPPGWDDDDFGWCAAGVTFTARLYYAAYGALPGHVIDVSASGISLAYSADGESILQHDGTAWLSVDAGEFYGAATDADCEAYLYSSGDASAWHLAINAYDADDGTWLSAMNTLASFTCAAGGTHTEDAPYTDWYESVTPD